MARGDSYGDINSFLKKQYDITLVPSSLSDIKKRYTDIIEAMQATIQQEELQGATALLRRSHRILHKKLDRAERDMTELEELDVKYRNNEVSSDEYKRKKATLMNVSIAEISVMSKNMHDQTKNAGAGDTPQLPAGDPAQTKALLDAIKAGDTVELQRIILNPQGQISPPV